MDEAPVIPTIQPESTNVHVMLAQLRTALNAMPMGVVISDPHGSEWWRNRTAHDLLGAGDGVIVATVDRAMVSATRGNTLTETVESSSIPVRSFSVRGVPTFDGGGLVIIEDQTDRVLTDRVRTDFVANISHELKTPLGAMSVLAETIAADQTDGDVARLSGRLVQEASRLAAVVDDLLELSRIEFGGEALTAPVNLREVVTEAAERIQGAAESKRIQIRVAEPSSNVIVAGDKRQLLSAINNLLDNAIKYSDVGRAVSITLHSEVDDGVICVKDEGVGIPKDDIPRIFERFYRVDPARNRETGGTGLGLAIVNHVVNNHRGTITVESELGHGSKFCLKLPLWSSGR